MVLTFHPAVMTKASAATYYPMNIFSGTRKKGEVVEEIVVMMIAEQNREAVRRHEVETWVQNKDVVGLLPEDEA